MRRRRGAGVAGSGFGPASLGLISAFFTAHLAFVSRRKLVPIPSPRAAQRHAARGGTVRAGRYRPLDLGLAAKAFSLRFKWRAGRECFLSNLPFRKRGKERGFTSLEKRWRGTEKRRRGL